jgi:hypothetical protein
MRARKSPQDTQDSQEPQEEIQPMRARRAVITGGAVGLAAIAGAALSSAPPALAQTLPSITDWINVKNAPYNAAGNGSTDDTKAIQDALYAAAEQTIEITQTTPTKSTTITVTVGGVVYLPYGIYVTSAPLVIPAQVMLLGAVPASADMTSQPGIYGNSGWSVDYAGSIIMPSQGWSNPEGYLNPGVLYVDGTVTGGVPRPVISNLWVDGSNLTNAVVGGVVVPNTTAVAGLSVYGGSLHGEVYGVGIFNMPTSGMSFLQDGSMRTDGWSIRDCVVQSWGTGSGDYGIYWEGDDTQFVNVHVQAAPKSTAGGSCWYIQAGGNNRWVSCRADQSGDAGWTFDCNPGGTVGNDSPGTSNALIGCGTENNANYGLHLMNSSVSGEVTGGQMRVPVVAVGCAFGFDGRTNSTGGAGARVEGYNTLFLDNCTVLTSADGYPEYGLVTALSPVTTGQTGTAPALIRAFGGIWNCQGTPLVDDTADMIGAGTLWVDVHYVDGGTWLTSTPIQHYLKP